MWYGLRPRKGHWLNTAAEDSSGNTVDISATLKSDVRTGNLLQMHWILEVTRLYIVNCVIGIDSFAPIYAVCSL